MKSLFRFILCVTLELVLLPMFIGDVAWAADEDVAAPSRSRYLLLDSRVVAKIENARLAVGSAKKYKANPLFVEDKPWEKRFDNLYGNVIYDGSEKLYKCWYSPFIVDHSAKGMSLEERKKAYRPPRGREMGICYATSKDGVRWEKPNLGLVEYEGSKANNIVWRGPHGAGVFHDPHDSDPLRRYKMIYQGLNVSSSADGIHWAAPRTLKGISVAGDTHNNALWAPTLHKYVGITRTWGQMGREVMRLESPDFKSWAQDQVVLRATDKTKQPYAMPVFYHGGVYLGLVAVHHQPPVDRVWTELAWSSDTRVWHRIDEGTPLIPWSDKPLDYDYGCVYACACPVFLENQIRLYYGGSDYLHYGWRAGSLCLATLRPDGFAGYEQIDGGSNTTCSVVTRPVTVVGNTLSVSADVSPSGYVQVTADDKDNKPLAEGELVTSTVTDGAVHWKDGFALKDLKDQQIKLRFELRAAKLFSFGFED